MMTAITESPASVSNLINRQHSPGDYLSYLDIEREYPGTVKASTISVWVCAKRYGFDQLITKIGRSSRIRRDRWEGFLESRTACNSRVTGGAA